MVAHQKKSIFLYLIMSLRIFVGCTLFLSGLSKILNFDNFTMVAYSYKILPISIAPLFIFVLPIVEYSIGLLLILGVKIRISAIVSTLLFVIFIIAVGVNIFRGNNSSCGCFTIIHDNKIGFPLLIQDIFLFFVSLIIFFNGNRSVLKFSENKYLTINIMKKIHSLDKSIISMIIFSSIILMFSVGFNSKHKLFHVEDLYKHNAVNFYSKKVNLSKFRDKNL